MGEHRNRRDNEYTRQANIERLALRLFDLADRNGQLITRAWCDRRLAELREHRVRCRCVAPCAAARSASASKVYWTAASWQMSIAQT